MTKLLKCKIVNIEGEEVGEQKLATEVFDVKMNEDLVYKVVMVKSGNSRRNLSLVKTRSEVRGGGAKPWKQKGTGRARAGSNNSPIWRGGGITFGPTKNRNFKRTVTKKEARKAIQMVLSDKLRDKSVLMVDKLKFDKEKTSLGSKMLSNLKLSEKKVLIYHGKDEKIGRIFRNIPTALSSGIWNVNILDLLKYERVLISESAYKDLINRYSSKNK